MKRRFSLSGLTVGVFLSVYGGELSLESTYTSVSVEYAAAEAKNGVKLEYRAAGEKAWCPALAPLYYRREGAYRGSIVRLAEDTEYEVHVLAFGKETASGTVRTWKTDVPVAKTVSLDVEGVKFPIRIRETGKPDGWIRLVPKGGKTLVNSGWKTTLDFSGSAYVILDGFTIRGGKGKPSVLVTDCHDVRIRNCELSDYGPGGPSSWKNKGYCFENGIGCQNGAILMKENVKNVTVERTVIHTPRGRAHSWRYSHPYGPAAIQVYRPESVVIRWCDFFTCDSRRFEDCVKCTENGGDDAGLNRNSDVYGCFLFGANDDNIELDGGQRNVRCFGNRFEEALMGVSVQYCNRSPSYVFDNLFTGLGTEFGHRCSHIKTASVDGKKYGAASYFFHNTFTGPCSEGGALNMAINGSTARLTSKNNLFVGAENRFKGGTGTRYGVAAGNHEVAVLGKAVPSETAVPNFSPNAKNGKASVGAPGTGERLVRLPERPVPWFLDVARLDAFAVKGGVATKGSATFNLECTDAKFKRKFRVVKPSVDADWFEVKPSSGEIKGKKKIAFTVTIDPKKMLPRRRHACAFVVRDEDGFSRPVSVHVATDYVWPEVNPAAKGVVVYALESGAGEEAKAKGKTKAKGQAKGPAKTKGQARTKTSAAANVWTFDIREGGTYYLFVRGTSAVSDGLSYTADENSLKLVIDGRERDVAHPQLVKEPTWAPVTPDSSDIYGYELKPGRHTVELVSKSEGLAIDTFAWAKDPTDMEGDRRHDEHK